MRQFFRNIFTIFTIIVVTHILYMIYDGTRQPEHNADAALVLGTTVNEDGTLSDRLQARLDRAFELYQEGTVPLVIVSGGFGKEGHYEGDKMQSYLVDKGMPKNAVIIDNSGNNTSASARNAKEIAIAEGLHSVILVSQYFHITRSKMLFRKEGFTDIQGASPHYIEIRDVYSIPREVAGYYYYLFK